MTDRELMQQGYEVPLVEQLDAVPRDARLWIKDSDGMGSRHFPIGLMCHKAAEALRARLSQPEPEPVAWCRDFMQHSWVEVVNEDGDVWILDSVLEVGRIEAATKAGLSVTPLYKKKEWQGLTDEEMLNAYAPNRIPDSAYSNMGDDLKKIHDAAKEEMLSGLRAIEAKLKEMNSE